MRSDLTSAFLAKMVESSRVPIQLLVIHFDPLTYGDVCLADRDITISGTTYSGIIENWGTLATVGAEEGISGTMTTTITAWNGGNLPLSLRFMAEDPVNIFVDIYQTFEGLAAEDFAHIGEFVIQDPIEWGESSSLIAFDLITTNMRYFGQVGSLLTKERFPRALETDLNKPINLIVGDAGRVQTICSQKPPVTSLDRSIVSRTATIEVTSNLDDLGFPQSGRVQINGELIDYSSRGDFSITASLRGASNTVTLDHSAGSEVILANVNVDYIVGQYPLSKVDSVWVNGNPTTQSYSIVNDSNRGVVLLRFPEQPIYEDLSPNKDTQIFFDNTTTANTAINAYYAYAYNYLSDGAVLNSGHDVLSISNTQDMVTTNSSGEIVNVFLEVTHWATLSYSAEYIDVWVDGVGVIGQLTKPNQAADFTFEADVDIDHPHIHESGQSHSHSNIDSISSVVDPQHINIPYETITTTILGTQYEYAFRGSGSSFCLDPNTYYFNFTDSEIPKNSSSEVAQISYTLEGSEGAWIDWVFVEYRRKIGSSYTTVVSKRIESPGVAGVVTIPYAYYYNSPYTNGDDRSIRITSRICQPESGDVGIVYSNPVISFQERLKATAKSSLVSATNSVGSVRGIIENPSIIKDVNDVTPFGDPDNVGLPTQPNRDVQISSTGLYTQSFTDEFDLLDIKNLDIDWEWFSGREIELRFNGSSTGVDVYITWVQFRIEYREQVLKTTDDVSCEVVGSIDNRPDAVLQYLLTEKAGLPVGKLGSVDRNIPVWDDSHVWDDNEVWMDEGQVEGVPDGANFEEAASWFAYHNYAINGVLQGNQTIKDAIRDITWQTRSKLLWQNGECQLVILRESDDWMVARDLEPEDIRIQSINTKKSRVDQIVNKIDLFHTIDRLSLAPGSGQYDATAFISDKPSIRKHGERSNDTMWLFYLVRNEDMANHIAEYYIWLLGESSTYYTFEAYLNNFDIEKHDYVTITSSHIASINKLKLEIKELVRSFGSGKLGTLNVLQMIGHSIRRKFFPVEETDGIIMTDSLNVEAEFDSDIGDSITFTDFLLLTWTVEELDSMSLTDVLTMVAVFNSTVNDSVTLTDTITSDFEMVIDDEINLSDGLEIAEELCFGSCGFGGDLNLGTGRCELPFGAKTEHRSSPFDAVGLTDVLVADMGIVPDDTNEVTLADELVFSDGFGCPTGLGSGLGVSPFGC